LCEFERETERYQFKANILLHEEQVVMGNKATILIKAYLMLNEREKADLRLLEGSRVTVQTFNEVDSISVSKVYENVEFREEAEYEIELQIPANIRDIKVTVETSVNVSFINWITSNIECCIRRKAKVQ
jgi:hypothetical protein